MNEPATVSELMKGLSQNQKPELCMAPGLVKRAQHLSQSGRACLCAGYSPPAPHERGRTVSAAEGAPDLLKGALPRQSEDSGRLGSETLQVGSQGVAFCQGMVLTRTWQ